MTRKRTPPRDGASPSALASLLTHPTIRKFAGPAYFERGEGYFAEGRVRGLIEDGESLSAQLCGAEDYRVKLWVEGGQLAASCTCPLGEEGAFCKHCVAVGLTWLERPGQSSQEGAKSKTPRVTIADVRSFLSARPKEELVELVIEQAKDDARLCQDLLLQAAKATTKACDLDSLKGLIDLAVENDGFVHYREAYAYAQRIEEAVDSVEKLLKEGYAKETVELSEYALAAVEGALGSVDDSDGSVGGILERLGELHLAACEKARPDPVALARRLFNRELHDDWGILGGAPELYAEVLGEKGLAEYRRLAEAEWKRLPASSPAGKAPEDYDHKRYRITHMMEALARQSGNLEELVAIKSRDLSLPYAYLSIAQIYQEAGQHDLALEWAEKGLRAFPDRPDSRLREFLANQYHRRKQHDRAMALIWEEFAEAPGLHCYQQLKSHAEKSGEWPAWREKALAFLRDTIKRLRGKLDRNTWMRIPADHSELVQIFLWEKDPEAAWQEAQAGGCSASLWLELARKREKDYPADVLPVYQRQVEPTLDQKNNQAYAEAVKLLQKIKALMAALGWEREFGPYLEAIRAKHKPKRNFIKMLDRSKLI